VETRNRYWMLDCILAITAIALGTTAVCSFAGLAVPPQSGMTLAVEVLICGAAIGIGLLFAALVWHEHREAMRVSEPRSHQELHARFMKRVAPRIVEIPVVAPVPFAADESANAYEVPETLLVTSLTDVKTERSVQRRQQARRAAEKAAATAA